MAWLDYRAAVREIESRGIMPEQAPGLERFRAALERIPFHIPPERVVVVAGTNGKGSTCATLEALLISAGKRTGLYTSPHLIETTERFRIQGKDVSRELFCLAHEACFHAARDLSLSHFEMLTLMAAWIFGSGRAIDPMDWLVLEVGLGGLWDATNAIPHQGCVIAPLGLDHQNLLGDSIESIARNKFGIVTPGAWVAHAEFPTPSVARIAEETARQTRSRWRISEIPRWQARSTGSEPEFLVQTRWGEAAICLAGPRGAQNTALALTAFELMGFDPACHLSGLSQVRWPGRMERINAPQSPCAVYLSGDHNPPGIASLLELLPSYPREHLHLVLGIGKDKDACEILSLLTGTLDSDSTSIYLTETPFRGRTIAEYGDWLGRAQGAWKDPEQALQRAFQRASPRDLVLITGSLYLVGQIKNWLEQSADGN